MSIRCWLCGHDFEEVERWSGNAYNKIKVSLVYSACKHCGKMRRTVDISGALTKSAAEVICIDNTKETDFIELSDVVVDESKPKTKKAS